MHQEIFASDHQWIPGELLTLRLIFLNDTTSVFVHTTAVTPPDTVYTAAALLAAALFALALFALAFFSFAVLPVAIAVTAGTKMDRLPVQILYAQKQTKQATKWKGLMRP